jgi:hypothetical protein
MRCRGGWGDVDWNGLAQDRDRWRAGIEPSGSIKCWEIIEYPNKWDPSVVGLIIIIIIIILLFLPFTRSYSVIGLWAVEFARK